MSLSPLCQCIYILVSDIDSGEQGHLIVEVVMDAMPLGHFFMKDCENKTNYIYISSSVFLVNKFNFQFKLSSFRSWTKFKKFIFE